MWSTQQRATRPAELVFKPKVYGRFGEGVTVLSEATVTLGGVYVALTYSTDMDMVLLLRSYYKNNYATNRTHTQRRQQTFVDVESPVLPFSLTGVSHFHQPSPSSPLNRCC